MIQKSDRTVKDQRRGFADAAALDEDCSLAGPTSASLVVFVLSLRLGPASRNTDLHNVTYHVITA